AVARRVRSSTFSRFGNNRLRRRPADRVCCCIRVGSRRVTGWQRCMMCTSDWISRVSAHRLDRRAPPREVSSKVPSHSEATLPGPPDVNECWEKVAAPELMHFPTGFGHRFCPGRMFPRGHWATGRLKSAEPLATNRNKTENAPNPAENQEWCDG